MHFQVSDVFVFSVSAGKIRHINHFKGSGASSPDFDFVHSKVGWQESSGPCFSSL